MFTQKILKDCSSTAIKDTEKREKGEKEKGKATPETAAASRGGRRGARSPGALGLGPH